MVTIKKEKGKKYKKRVWVGIILSIVLCIENIMPIFAASDENEKIKVGQSEIESIKIDGEEVLIPIQKINKAKIFSPVDNEEINLFIPVTQEAKKYNDALISGMESRLVNSNQYFDTAGYLKATSTINFTRDYYQGHPRIKMTSYRVTKNRNVDSYLVGLGHPTITAYQLGYYGPAGYPQTMDQIKYFGNVSWDTTYNIPSSWLPVCTDIGTHTRGVKVQVLLIYSNGNGSTREERCDFFHPCS